MALLTGRQSFTGGPARYGGIAENDEGIFVNRSQTDVPLALKFPNPRDNHHLPALGIDARQRQGEFFANRDFQRRDDTCPTPTNGNTLGGGIPFEAILVTPFDHSGQVARQPVFAPHAFKL